MTDSCALKDCVMLLAISRVSTFAIKGICPGKEHAARDGPHGTGRAEPGPMLRQMPK
jgi:hypothetical protein